MELTKREKELVREIWVIVQKDAKGSGIELFIRLFTAVPSLQPLFKGFDGIPLDELRVSPRLAAHGTGVIYAVSGLVANLDDQGCALAMLEKFGENHARRGIKEAHFHNLKEVFMKLLKDGCGTAFTPEAEGAWSKMWDYIIEGILVGLNPS